MIKFPTIKEGQVVLLRSETQTGHVLDEQFNLAMNETQKVYTVFNSVEEALQQANQIIADKNNLIECTIQGKNQEVLYYLNPFKNK